MTTETTSDRRDPRGMLAEIALATELPVPKEVSFLTDLGILSLRLATIADGVAWKRHLRPDDPERDSYISHSSGLRHLDHGVITWQGWRVNLSAHEPAAAPSEPLPADTTARLTELAST